MPEHDDIVDGHDDDFIPLVRELFREYSEWLGVDLCFQGFDAELATLPGKYAPPAGAILLATVDATVAGCVTLRSLGPSICEMKRLWVRAPFRGTGIGRSLISAVIARAQSIGYSRIRLDTLPQMKAALALYRKAGFCEIPPYYSNPIPGAIYLQLNIGTLD